MTKKAHTESYSVYTNKQGAYEVEIKTHLKKKNLVIPVTMMVEGVHNGSHGPLLHLIDDLGKFPASWDGIPVVINHPQKEGVNVSANSPDIIEERCTGRVYGTYVDGTKLRAYVWLEEEKLGSISEDALLAINEKQPIEVSVGVFTEDEIEEGEYNGENYEAIARNHRPDHLALLPDGVGACSLKDGCGLRANKQKGGNNVKQEVSEAMRLLNKEGFVASEIKVNEEDGYQVRLDAVRNYLYSMDSDAAYYYLEELFDDHLVYVVRLKIGGSHMYKQSYTYADDKVELTGDPTEVRKKVSVEYVANEANGLQRTKFNTNKNKEVNTMEKEKCTPCVLKKVDDLIGNNQGFTEEDRDYLQGLTEERLDKLFKKEEKPLEVNKAAEEKKEEKPAEKQAVQALSEEDKADLAWAKSMRQAKRAKLIEGIQANAKDVWTPEELKAMSESQLEKIYNVSKKEEDDEEVADYTLRGGSPKVNSTQAPVLLPTGVTAE